MDFVNFKLYCIVLKKNSNLVYEYLKLQHIYRLNNLLYTRSNIPPLLSY